MDLDHERVRNSGLRTCFPRGCVPPWNNPVVPVAGCVPVGVGCVPTSLVTSPSWIAEGRLPHNIKENNIIQRNTFKSILRTPRKEDNSHFYLIIVFIKSHYIIYHIDQER